MKINADERNYTTLDEIEDEMIQTIGGWSDSRIEETIKFPYSISCYINDWFHDYELTDEEYEEITDIVLDFFKEEE